MANLTVRGEAGGHVVPFSPGPTLLELMQEAGVFPRAGCGGSGRCGLCRVVVDAENLPAPTSLERLRLAPAEVAKGLRLACQLRPEGDLAAWVADSIPPSWNLLAEDELCAFGPAIPIPRDLSEASTGLGVAVDLGTTQIRLALWDMVARQRLEGRLGANPQGTHGADVIARLTAAAASPEVARELARLVRDTIGDGIRGMVSRQGRRLDEVRDIVVVGNTAMLLLLAGGDSRQLLQPENWSRWLDCGPSPRDECVSAWGLATEARLELIPSLSGFVGSDLLACVLATSLMDGPGGALLIDFGTNSEIALWDGHVLWVTSAAGGPAFEGSGIRFGMPAEPGAIHRVVSDGDGLRGEVIGGGTARGVCGSGLVDCVALMLGEGCVTAAGRFSFEDHRTETAVLSPWPDILLTESDLDLFQRAKAAIGAGTAQLMACTGIRELDLRRVCVCGAFGRLLNTANAQAVGLLPKTSEGIVALCGGAALAGCEYLLLHADRAGEWARVKRMAHAVNLAMVPEFEESFVSNLRLAPMRLA